jgi:hypothetical protein
VLCYTCGVLIDYQALRWDGAQWVESSRRACPSAPEPVRAPFNRALGFGRRDVGRTRSRWSRGRAQAPQDDGPWDIALLRAGTLREQAAGRIAARGVVLRRLRCGDRAHARV